ncbi:hypothetical protein [Tenacibaculum sp.]|uniref:hypothetical protein n=1 Tax=Tenacibaculum sp. TaxID=1906242 RepID=UPI003D1299A8
MLTYLFQERITGANITVRISDLQEKREEKLLAEATRKASEQTGLDSNQIVFIRKLQ